MGTVARAKKSSPKRRVKKPDDKHAHKIADTPLETLQRVLVLVGKPFYYLISATLIALIFIVYSVGNTIRQVFTLLAKYSLKILELIGRAVITLTIFVFNKTKDYKNTYFKESKKLGLSYRKKKKLYTKLLLAKRIEIVSIAKNKRKKTNFSSYYLKTKKKIIRPIGRTYFLVIDKPKLLIVSIKLKLLKLAEFKIQIPKPSIRFRYIFATAFLLVLITIPVFIVYSTLKDLPSVHELTNRNIEVSTKIYDRNGLLLYKIYKDKNRTIIPIEDIPPEMIYATLAAEDAEFYSHPGISIKGMARSLYKNATEGKLTGGSTITQQLVKNALLTPEKTVKRKLREIVLAIQVETTFTKDEILEMYLNEVSYGSTAYGIQEAAQYYFGIDAKDLDLGEAALLAGLPKGPTTRSPFGHSPELGIVRQGEILRQMHTRNFIDDKSYEKYINKELTFTSNKTEILAPHFVMYTRQLLENEYGREMVETGGLEVTTTLDYTIQQLAETVVKSELENLNNLHVGNAAVVVMNPKTGEILAMVGSRDYFDTENDGNVNATVALRQPGSSIKVVNYAYALSNGITPASIVDDAPISFNIAGQSPYAPRNYDGKYRGRITIRSAFAESRNIPAVKVLATYGVDNMIATGQAMGITTWNDPSRFGLSLTLGGGEIKLIDLASVYSTVANYGIKSDLKIAKSLINYKGKTLRDNDCESKNESKFKIVNPIETVHAETQAELLNFKDLLENSSCESEQVLDPRVAYMLTDILRDNDARSPAFGSHSQLVIPGHPEVAVKTGTSNNLRDNLTVGYNQDYLVAVWVGNNDNTPMSRIASGLTGASTIWNKIMSGLLINKPSTEWQRPGGLAQASICPRTGTLACNGCNNRNEWFLEENQLNSSCNYDVFNNITKKKKDKKNRRQALDPEIVIEL